MVRCHVPAPAPDVAVTWPFAQGFILVWVSCDTSATWRIWQPADLAGRKRSAELFARQPGHLLDDRDAGVHGGVPVGQHDDRDGSVRRADRAGAVDHPPAVVGVALVQPFFNWNASPGRAAALMPHDWSSAIEPMNARACATLWGPSGPAPSSTTFSRRNWSATVVVVFPHTAALRTVDVSPNRRLACAIRFEPPTASHRSSAASLSLSPIICRARLRSVWVSSRCASWATSSNVASTSTLTMLAVSNRRFAWYVATRPLPWSATATETRPGRLAR